MEKTNLQLIQAISDNDLISLEELLKKGADVDFNHRYIENSVFGKEEKIRTPLRCAVDQGNIDICRALINNGADPNLADEFHITPLHFAVSDGYSDICKLLLKNGADPNLLSGSHSNAFHHGATSPNCSIETYKSLLKKVKNINEKNQLGRTALMLASMKGKVDFMRLIIEKDADINVYSDSSETALLLAIEHNKLDAAKLLISKGADITIIDNNGNSLLKLAKKNKLRGIYKELKTKKSLFPILKIQSKRKLNSRLIDAISKFDLDKVMYLTNPDAGVNVKEGISPIIMACTNLHPGEYTEKEKEKVKIVELLIEKGAEINYVYKYYENLSIIEGDKIETALIKAVFHGHSEICNILLKNGADPNIKNEFGQNALHIAIYSAIYDENYSVSIIKSLLEYIHDIDDKDRNGETALIYAAKQNNAEIIKLVIEKGAEVDTQSDSGETALIWAIKTERPGIAKLLINNGADINVIDNEGNSPIILAKEKNMNEIYKD